MPASTVSLSSVGWVDVVQDGQFLKPKAFSGTRDTSISIAILPAE